jgi:hypothetical protein
MTHVLESMRAGSDLVNYGKRWVLEHQDGTSEAISCVVMLSLESADAIRIWTDANFARATLSTTRR